MNYQERKANIEINNLSVIYNKGQSNEVASLRNVNLKIYPNEYLIIFGPSGCGKSTLLYSVSGLQRPTEGEILIEERDINKMRKKEMVEFHRNKIGMIFQAFYLIPSLNILDNVCLPKIFTSDDFEARKEKSLSLLKRFNISEQSDKYPSELSGGQKQRVSIARSLMNDPEIILADEPVGNLDSVSSQNVMSILSELNSVDKKTVILVTHDPNHLQYGDRIIHMRDGRIVKEEIVRDKRPVKAKKEEDTVQENIPLSLRFLMKTFKSLSMEQIGLLTVPFKSKQLLSHIIFELTEEQISAAQKNLEKVIFDRINFEQYQEVLDKRLEDGGAGWDKRTAKNFVEKAQRILDQTKKIDEKNPQQSAEGLLNYIRQYFVEVKDGGPSQTLINALRERVENRIDGEQLRETLDLPSSHGGIGLDSRTAKKIAREIEVILLLKFLS